VFEHEHLQLVAVEQFQHPVAHVGHVAGEERVGARDAQELALLVLAAGRGAGGLAQHEVRSGLCPVEPGHARHDVLVPVQDEQELASGMSFEGHGST
jgi:hypothetical protein